MIDGAAYSVPYSAIGKAVDVHATAALISIFLRGRRIACHPRAPAGSRTTLEAHQPASHRAVARYTPEHLQAEFAAIGSAAALLFERILAAAEHREQAVRAGLGLLRLGGTHGAGRLEQACQAALEANVRSWRYVQRWLATGGPPHPTVWASTPTCADPPTTGTEQGPETMKHPTHEALRRLRLYGMARGLEDLERQPERSQLSFDDQLALLVERETAERANTALASRLKRARLRQTACLEDLDWRTPRGLDRTLVRDLASCRWVREHQPLLVTGPTGIGKTFVACALGNQAAREGYGVFYTRLTRLLDDLATARLDGSLARVLRRLARLEVLIIDDMTELTAARPDGSDRRPARPRRHGAGDPDPRGKLAPLDRRCHLRRRDPRPRRSPGAAYRTHGRVHASGAGGRPEIS